MSLRFLQFYKKAFNLTHVKSIEIIETSPRFIRLHTTEHPSLNTYKSFEFNSAATAISAYQSIIRDLDSEVKVITCPYYRPLQPGDTVTDE